MGWEIKRLLSLRITRITLVFALLVLGWFSFNFFRSFSGADKVKQNISKYQYYEQIDNEYETQEEKMERLQKDLESAESTSDLVRAMSGQETCKYVYERFGRKRERLINDTIYNIVMEQSKSKPDIAYINQNELALKYYNRVVDLRLASCRGTGDYVYFHNSMIRYTLLGVIVCLGVLCFTLDYGSSTYKAINSMTYRREKLLLCRYGAVAGIGLLMVIISTIYEWGIATFFDFISWSTPIQNFQDYEMCPFLVTQGQLFLLAAVLRCLVVLFVAAMVMLLCTLIRKPWLSAVLCVLTGIGTYVVYIFVEKRAMSNQGNYWIDTVYTKLRSWFPCALLDAKSYFEQFESVSIGNVAIMKLYVVSGVTVLGTAVMLILTMAISRKRRTA